MNTPTHIVSGILLAQLLSNQWPTTTWYGRLALGIACVAGGALLHLGLDALPHFAWIVYLPGLDGIPFRWLIKEAILAAIIAAPCIYFARKHWPFALLGMFGAIYPDMEKVASVDFHVADRFIVFKDHSLHLSSHDGGISHWMLIVGELGLIVFMMVGTYALAPPSRGNDWQSADPTDHLNEAP